MYTCLYTIAASKPYLESASAGGVLALKLSPCNLVTSGNQYAMSIIDQDINQKLQSSVCDTR